MSSFGDRVRVRETHETRQAGIAGLEGDIYGITTPSVTGVEVIGGAPDDCALNVAFANRRETFWVRPDLVEVLGHNAGMEIVVGNIMSVRHADGSWTTSAVDQRHQAKGTPGLWSRIRSLLN